MLIRIPIEVKSFFFNILNDNECGHTATVASILKQGGSLHEDVAQIYNVPDNIRPSSKQGLIDHILSKSRAEAKIVKICCFDKITVNGLPIETDVSFCAYVREEIGMDNVHCGRQKLHYPPTLVYSDSDVEINNKKIIKLISEKLSDFAFVVEAFEYDDEARTLNFDAVVLGRSGIPYSKVFINQKGTGNKFTKVFSEDNDDYDSEIIALRKKMGYDEVGPENFSEVMSFLRSDAKKIVAKSLMKKKATDVRVLSDEYPYAICDLEYKIDGVKYYAIVRYTTTTLKHFRLTSEKIEFLSNFSENASLCLVVDAMGAKVVCQYSGSQIREMNRSICAINFDASEIVE